MANWITHTFLAETLLMQGLPLDKRGFCIGNIAPDCNVENADWSVFTPPREVTHWMTGTSKLTSDYEGFYRKYIDKNQLQCSEEFSFFWGVLLSSDHRCALSKIRSGPRPDFCLFSSIV